MKKDLKSPEEMFLRLNNISMSQKKLAEEKLAIQTELYERFEDYEFPITIDEKLKHYRIHKPEGKFVYNVVYEVGSRVKSVKLWSDK